MPSGEVRFNHAGPLVSLDAAYVNALDIAANVRVDIISLETFTGETGVPPSGISVI